jgi:hypothetical protein
MEWAGRRPASSSNFRSSKQRSEHLTIPQIFIDDYHVGERGSARASESSQSMNAATRGTFAASALCTM